MIGNLGDVRVDRHGNRGAGRDLRDRRRQAAIDEDRRGDAPGQLAKLGQGVLRLDHRLLQDRLCLDRIASGLALGAGQVHVQPHEPLLRTVVQVPLQLPQRGALRLPCGGPRLGQSLDVRPVPRPTRQQQVGVDELEPGQPLEDGRRGDQHDQAAEEEQDDVEDHRMRDAE